MPAASRRAALVAGAATALLAVTAPGARAATGKGLVVLGDSWASGLYAEPAHALGQVAAATLGWSVRVDAVSGTGYVNGSADGQDYVSRARALEDRPRDRVVVVQGGSNDVRQPGPQVSAAIDRTVVLLRARFPHASLMLLGPGPDPEPVDAAQRHVDGLLRRAARSADVPYVSMLREDWIPASRASRVIDPGNAHPTVAGQRYLGRRLAAAIRHEFPRLVGA